MKQLLANWRNANTVLAAACLALAAIVFSVTSTYPDAPLALGGAPGFYPRVLAGLLAALAVVIFFEGLLNPPKITFAKGNDLYKLLATLGLLALTPMALDWLGFRPAGILLALAVMLLLTGRRELTFKTVVIVAVVAVAATLSLHYVFTEVASIPLPRGRIF